MGYITKQNFWLGTLYLTKTGKTWSMLILNAGLYSRNEYKSINKVKFLYTEYKQTQPNILGLQAQKRMDN